MAEEHVQLKKVQELEDHQGSRLTGGKQKRGVDQHEQELLMAPPKRVYSEFTQCQLNAIAALKEFKVKQRRHARQMRKQAEKKKKEMKCDEGAEEGDKENVSPGEVSSATSSSSEVDNPLPSGKKEPLSRKDLMFKSAKGQWFDGAESSKQLSDEIVNFMKIFAENSTRQTLAIESLAESSKQLSDEIVNFMKIAAENSTRQH